MVSIFHHEWWLDAATDGAWEMLESAPHSGVRGRLPIYIRRYFGQPIICLPPWTRSLGPIISELPGKGTTLMRARYWVIEDLISKLPAHWIFKQVFDPSITDLLAFQLNGFDVGVQYTFRLQDCTDSGAIWQGLRDKTRNVIRRAADRFKVGIDMPASEFAAFYFAHCDACPWHSRGRLEPLIRAAAQHGAGTVLYCTDRDDVTAAIFVVWDEVYAYFLISARDEQRAGNGAISLLLWEALKLAGHKGLSFDFDSFANRGGAMFVSQFGGQLVPRWVVSYLPSVVRLCYAPRSTIARWKAAMGSASFPTRRQLSTSHPAAKQLLRSAGDAQARSKGMFLYAHLPQRKQSYFVRDAHGNTISASIVGLRIDELATGSVVLSCVTDDGRKLNPTEHRDVESAERAAAEQFWTPDLRWSRVTTP